MNTFAKTCSLIDRSVWTSIRAALGCWLSLGLGGGQVYWFQFMSANWALIVLVEPSSNALFVEGMTAGKLSRNLHHLFTANGALRVLQLARRFDFAIRFLNFNFFQACDCIRACRGVSGSSHIIHWAQENVPKFFILVEEEDWLWEDEVVYRVYRYISQRVVRFPLVDNVLNNSRTSVWLRLIMLLWVKFLWNIFRSIIWGTLGSRWAISKPIEQFSKYKICQIERRVEWNSYSNWVVALIPPPVSMLSSWWLLLLCLLLSDVTCHLIGLCLLPVDLRIWVE